MDRRVKQQISSSIFLIFLFLLALSFSVSLAETSSKENPLTARASLIRYWNEHISNRSNNNNVPLPSFLLSKASPLSVVHSAYFTKLAAQNGLSSSQLLLSSFCSAANLFCHFQDSNANAAAAASSSASSSDPGKDANFASYENKDFRNYGTSGLGGVDLFKNYSDGINFSSSSFNRYSRGSNARHEGFASYAADGNVASSNFISYAAGAKGGSGDFKTYLPRVNVPDNVRFTSYDPDASNRKVSFTSYVEDTNSGNEAFTNYAKNGNSVPVDFSSYGDTSNVIGSSFTQYGESGNGANDSFMAYTRNANNPSNNYKNYGGGGNGGIDTFTSYRDTANAGTDTFQSYGRRSSSGKTNFLNYGKSFNEGVDAFKEYGEEAKNQSTGFKIYGVNNTFEDYGNNKKGVTFAGYTKPGSSGKEENGSYVNNWVEEGKFFREYMLKEGTRMMKMPDIRDKMPKRSFLPRAISSKLPFSTGELPAIKRIFFNAADDPTMEHVIKNALAECESAPSPGETKRCVGSVEDMIDFAVEVLGRNVAVRTTENVEGSKKEIMIGKVSGIDGGRITKSVSCHQSLYPYLLYYCHSVPKVRVYVADILDMFSKKKINNGVAICHIDTSAWSPGHGAFVALGSGPGLIEVCHWIYENDMIWTTAG